MPLRTALPLTLGALALLVVAGTLWKPATPEPPGPLESLDYCPPRGYVCYRARSPVVIDGKLDDVAWQDIPWSEEFVDIEGDAKPKPRFRTRMKMCWDDTALYIAAELEEPHVQGSFTKHDSYIFHEDHDFEVFLDPDGDNHFYAEFEMNALNTTWDLLLTRPYKDGGRPIDAWEINGLRTAVHVDGTINNPTDRDRGWTIEIAWPWQGLKQIATCPVPPQPGDQWRINFSRVELDFAVVDGNYRKTGRPEANWVWSPQGVVDMHRPETWGYVQFSDARPGEDRFRPDPTGPARALLHRIYHAQTVHRRTYDHYAASLAELGLSGLSHDSVNGVPSMEATSNWFEASVKLKDGRRVRIRADALVKVDE
jgi:hypothetical protein